MKAPTGLAGKSANCPICKSKVIVPYENQIHAPEDDFALAAVSLEDVDLDQVLKSFQHEQAGSSPQPGKSSKPRQFASTKAVRHLEAYIDRDPPPPEATIPSQDYLVLRRASIGLHFLSWMYAIYYFFAVAAIALGMDAVGQESGGPFLISICWKLLEGSTIVFSLMAAAEVLPVLIEIAVNSRRTRR